VSSVSGVKCVNQRRNSRFSLSFDGTKRLCSSIAVGFLTGLGSVDVVNAIGLTEVVQQSVLGEPLRVVIPVIANSDDASDDNLSGECTKLVAPPGERSDSDVPQLTSGRVSLERSARGAQLVVTSSRPINEPVLSLIVQVGCRDSIRRQYTLLLDPPAIETPMAEATGLTHETIPSELPRAETLVAAPRSEEAAVHSPPKRSPAAAKSNRSVSHHKSARTDSISKVASTAKPPAAGASSPKPRLSVSHGVQEAEHGGHPSVEDVDVETVVLKRRVEELSEMVLRMQQELSAARAERDAADAAAKKAAREVPSRAYQDWLLLIMALVLMALLLERWSQRRAGPRVPGALTAIDLDTLGSTPERTVFDTSEATMSPAPVLDLEESQANSGEPAESESPLPGQADVARGQVRPLDFRDPEHLFDEEFKPTERVSRRS
jgi:hypothetical protein